MLDRNIQYKISFSGVILSVQPRSNVWRYRLDNRTHGTTGYNIFLKGAAEGEVPDLSVYDWRGCRMLAAASWKKKCFTCKWACMANVAVEYNWGVTQKFRFGSFCYGPKSCRLYKMGKPRAVPYKDCGSFYDEGWLDEICTERRGEDE